MKTYKVEVYSSGNRYWYNEKDQRHREDGPAVEFANGTKAWYINSKRHREDGPAIEGAGGNKSWYINDKLHREDGPAIEFTSGTKFWYINDKCLTEKEFNNRNNVELTLDEIATKFNIPISQLKIKK